MWNVSPHLSCAKWICRNLSLKQKSLKVLEKLIQTPNYGKLQVIPLLHFSVVKKHYFCNMFRVLHIRVLLKQKLPCHRCKWR